MEVARRIGRALRRRYWRRRRPAEPTRRIFYIESPPYRYQSSGVRSLYLLCHHLNRLGYQAFVTGSGCPLELTAPSISWEKIEANRRAGIGDIVIYPEIIPGNPLHARNVVRYLLNKPGFFTGQGMETYGQDDFFIHFAEEFLPRLRLRRSFELKLPVVDPRVFHEESLPRNRCGFLLYSHRHEPNMASLPSWLSPYTILSMKNPRSADALAELYRKAAALVIWERTAAIGEAIQCGCPVIIAPNPAFQYQPIVRRYRGDGISVGWDRKALRRAQTTVAIAKESYWLRFRNLDADIHTFVKLANEHFDTRW